MKEITINAAAEEYAFKDENGKALFTLAFYPSDVGILNRYEDLVSALNEIDVKNIDENSPIQEVSALLKSAEESIFERIDKFFNAPMSKEIFAVMSPFAPLKNGKLYVEEVMDSLGSIIESELKVRTTRMKLRMQKYTGKYTNG